MTLWQQVIANGEEWLQQKYPHLTPVWVQGVGAQNPAVGLVRFPMMVSCVYPVPDEIPQDIQAILDHPSLAARPP